MRVLRVITTMDPQAGGVVEAVRQSILPMQKKNIYIDVLCLDARNSDWAGVVEGINIIAIGKSFSGYGVNFNYLTWLWKNAKKYDLVIIDGLWQFISVGGYILKSLKISYCVFTHGMLDPYFNINKFKYLKKLPFWFCVERNILANANAVIFTCVEEKILAAQSFPAYRSIPRIATLGVEGCSTSSTVLKNSFFKDFPELRDKRFALFLSRIHPKKGIDLLIDALTRLQPIPDDFVIAIAGPDSVGLKAKLVKQLNSLGLKDKVIWLGMLDGDVKWGAYHAAEVFVLPSHQENFGIVVAEALSTGTPTLITDKVNIWREVLEGSAGFVRKDDIDGVVGLLSDWLCLSENEKNNMRVNAELCYRNNFSIESLVQDLEVIVLEVLQKNGIRNGQ